MFFAIAGNDCGKTFAVAQSTAKTAKVFPLERFALYGMLVFDEVKVACQLIWNSRSQTLSGLAMTTDDMSSLIDA